MADDAARNMLETDRLNSDQLDPSDQRRTYQGVMRVSGEIGVPFALALTMFFTNLVLANGFGVALIMAALTYVATFFIVKTFFSH
ncbi:MAG: hypothetical protein AAGC56_09785 [Pseudomonadota bacterium]